MNATSTEDAAIAKQRAARDTRAPRPKMKTVLVETDGGGHEARIEVDHPNGEVGHDLLEASLASTDWNFTGLMLAQLAALEADADLVAGAKEGVDKIMAGNLAIVQAVEPQNEIETMLAVQMAAVHGATMQMASKLRVAASPDRAEQIERSLSRLARTFAAQMEALKRCRSKGEQRVVVEHQHVHVYPGGQAVVGTLNQGGATPEVGGGELKCGEQCHERSDEQLLLPERTAVLGAIEADWLQMQSTGGDGQERMQVSRRPSRRATGGA